VKTISDNLKALLSILCVVSLCASCSTIDDLQRGGGTKFLVQNQSYDKVWQASILVVSRQLTIVETDKSTGTIKAEKGAGMTTWGEVVGVFISPDETARNTFVVEVESLKRDSGQITGQDWTLTIVEGIKAELGVS
jgi:hypothetical protein